MGKLNIRFFIEGIEFGTAYIDEMKLGPMYYYKGIYNMANMEKLEFEGEDFNFDIYLNEPQNGIDWEKQTYPNELVKGKVLEIVYFADIANQIKKLLENITNCRFENKYDLSGFARQAMQLIQKSEPSKYFADLKSYNVNNFASIEHTLGKEVQNLNETKESASRSRKQDALSEAKSYLKSDINEFLSPLQRYEVNDKKN